MESQFVYVVIIKDYDDHSKQHVTRVFYKQENAEKFIEESKQDLKRMDKLLHTESHVDFEIKSALIE